MTSTFGLVIFFSLLLDGRLADWERGNFLDAVYVGSCFFFLCYFSFVIRSLDPRGKNFSVSREKYNWMDIFSQIFFLKGTGPYNF